MSLTSGMSHEGLFARGLCRTRVSDPHNPTVPKSTATHSSDFL